jgi:hypothetical protein
VRPPGPGHFLPAEVAKQGGPCGLTPVSPDLDGRSVADSGCTSKSTAVATSTPAFAPLLNSAAFIVPGQDRHNCSNCESLLGFCRYTPVLGEADGLYMEVHGVVLCYS